MQFDLDALDHVLDSFVPPKETQQPFHRSTSSGGARLPSTGSRSQSRSGSKSTSPPQGGQSSSRATTVVAGPTSTRRSTATPREGPRSSTSKTLVASQLPPPSDENGSSSSRRGVKGLKVVQIPKSRKNVGTPQLPTAASTGNTLTPRSAAFANARESKANGQQQQRQDFDDGNLTAADEVNDSFTEDIAFFNKANSTKKKHGPLKNSSESVENESKQHQDGTSSFNASAVDGEDPIDTSETTAKTERKGIKVTVPTGSARAKKRTDDLARAQQRREAARARIAALASAIDSPRDPGGAPQHFDYERDVDPGVTKEDDPVDREEEEPRGSTQSVFEALAEKATAAKSTEAISPPKRQSAEVGERPEEGRPKMRRNESRGKVTETESKEKALSHTDYDGAGEDSEPESSVYGEEDLHQTASIANGGSAEEEQCCNMSPEQPLPCASRDREQSESEDSDTEMTAETARATARRQGVREGPPPRSSRSLAGEKKNRPVDDNVRRLVESSDTKTLENITVLLLEQARSRRAKLDVPGSDDDEEVVVPHRSRPQIPNEVGTVHYHHRHDHQRPQQRQVSAGPSGGGPRRQRQSEERSHDDTAVLEGQQPAAAPTTHGRPPLPRERPREQAQTGPLHCVEQLPTSVPPPAPPHREVPAQAAKKKRLADHVREKMTQDVSGNSSSNTEMLDAHREKVSGGEGSMSFRRQSSSASSLTTVPTERRNDWHTPHQWNEERRSWSAAASGTGMSVPLSEVEETVQQPPPTSNNNDAERDSIPQPHSTLEEARHNFLRIGSMERHNTLLTLIQRRYLANRMEQGLLVPPVYKRMKHATRIAHQQQQQEGMESPGQQVNFSNAVPAVLAPLCTNSDVPVMALMPYPLLITTDVALECVETPGGGSGNLRTSSGRASTGSTDTLNQPQDERAVVALAALIEAVRTSADSVSATNSENWNWTVRLVAFTREAILAELLPRGPSAGGLRHMRMPTKTKHVLVYLTDPAQALSTLMRDAIEAHEQLVKVAVWCDMHRPMFHLLRAAVSKLTPQHQATGEREAQPYGGEEGDDHAGYLYYSDLVDGHPLLKHAFLNSSGNSRSFSTRNIHPFLWRDMQVQGKLTADAAPLLRVSLIPFQERFHVWERPAPPLNSSSGMMGAEEGNVTGKGLRVVLARCDIAKAMSFLDCLFVEQQGSASSTMTGHQRTTAPRTPSCEVRPLSRYNGTNGSGRVGWVLDLLRQCAEHRWTTVGTTIGGVLHGHSSGSSRSAGGGGGMIVSPEVAAKERDEEDDMLMDIISRWSYTSPSTVVLFYAESDRFNPDVFLSHFAEVHSLEAALARRSGEHDHSKSSAAVPPQQHPVSVALHARHYAYLGGDAGHDRLKVPRPAVFPSSAFKPALPVRTDIRPSYQQPQQHPPSYEDTGRYMYMNPQCQQQQQLSAGDLYQPREAVLVRSEHDHSLSQLHFNVAQTSEHGGWHNTGTPVVSDPGAASSSMILRTQQPSMLAVGDPGVPRVWNGPFAVPPQQPRSHHPHFQYV